MALVSRCGMAHVNIFNIRLYCIDPISYGTIVSVAGTSNQKKGGEKPIQQMNPKHEKSILTGYGSIILGPEKRFLLAVCAEVGACQGRFTATFCS